MHAARLVAAHDALLSLLVEHSADCGPHVDGVTASFTFSDGESTLDLSYTSRGMPVGGEGV